MSEIKLRAAAELIRERHYEAARAVLETMPGDPIASRWLTKLDDIAGTSRSNRALPMIFAVLALIAVVVVLLLSIAVLLSPNRTLVDVLLLLVIAGEAVVFCVVVALYWVKQ
jgi:membrane-associated HD superfamily phosphohydrolase